jgi:hypothetical protein
MPPDGLALGPTVIAIGLVFMPPGLPVLHPTVAHLKRPIPFIQLAELVLNRFLAHQRLLVRRSRLLDLPFAI